MEQGAVSLGQMEGSACVAACGRYSDGYSFKATGCELVSVAARGNWDSHSTQQRTHPVVASE